VTATAGQGSSQPLIGGKCVGREARTALKQMAFPEVFRRITGQSGMKLIKITG
jgi:hypothetical protein